MGMYGNVHVICLYNVERSVGVGLVVLCICATFPQSVNM